MHIIKIPNNVNKYNYVLHLLGTLQNTFNEYTFINCTESPIDEFEYYENSGIHYRVLKKIKKIISTAVII